MSSPCLICDGVTTTTTPLGDIDEGETEKGREALVKFFRFLERHLEGNGVDKEGQGGRKREGLSFDKVLAAEEVPVFACDNCLQIVESFSQLYDQMKSVELRLNWKLETLKNLMSCEGRKDSRMEGVPNIFVDFKRKLVKKCKLKLKANFPKLVLTEVIVSPGTDSNVTIDVDQDAVSIIPVGNLENELSSSVAVDQEGHSRTPSPFSQISESSEKSEKSFSKVVLTKDNMSSDQNENVTIHQEKLICRPPITNLETEHAIASSDKDGYTPVLDKSESESPEPITPKTSVNRIIDFREDLVKKCKEQFERGFPKVIITKLPVLPDENSTSDPNAASITSRIAVTSLSSLDFLEPPAAFSDQDQEGYIRTHSPLSECEPAESDSEVPVEEDEILIGSVNPEFLLALHGNYEEDISMDWIDDDDTSADLPDTFPLEVKLELDDDLESSTNIADTELPTRHSVTSHSFSKLEERQDSNKNEEKQRAIKYRGHRAKTANPSGSESDASDYSSESESESESVDSDYNDDRKKEMKERAKQNQLKYQAIRAQKRAKRSRSGLRTGIPCKLPGCPERLFTPQSPEESEDHAKLHGDFPCSFCGLVHNYAPDLAWHEFTKHSKDSSGKECQENFLWSCPRPHCSYKNKDKSKFISHHVTSHLKLVPNGPMNTCSICKSVFSDRPDKQRLHYFSHHDLSNGESQNNAHKCDQKDCPAYFLNERQLVIHKRRHHSSKPVKRFTCEIVTCKRSFSTRKILKSHEIREHGISSGVHRCTFPECNRGFETEHNLAQHFKLVHEKLDKGKDRTIADSKERPINLVEIPCTVPDCPERLFTPRSTRESENHSRLHGNFPCSFCDLAHTYAPDLAWHEFLKHSPNSSEEECQENVARSCPRPNCSFQHENKLECIKHNLSSHMKLIPNGLANTCNICKYVVLSKKKIGKTLKQHHRTNHELNGENNRNDPHKCDQEDCPAYFLTARQLSNHKLNTHLIQAPLICKISGCNESFAGQDSLQLHKRQMHGIIGDHGCTFPECNRTFETERNLAVHFAIAHKKTKLSIKCPKCDKLCLTQSALKSHLKTHLLDPTSPEQSRPESFPFSCDICSKKFKTQQKLDTHIKSMHTKNSSEFLCKICGKGFLYRIALRNHMNQRHPNLKKDKQSELRKLTETDLAGSENDVSEHSTKVEQNKTDEKNRKFVKNRCTKTKAINKSTRTDSTSPKPSKQFLCKPCGKTFKGKMSLERHQRSHSASETKKRQTQQKLDNHIKTTHTKNSTQFHCEICGKEFAYRMALRTHMNQRHPDQCEDEDMQNDLRKTNLTSKNVSKIDLRKRKKNNE